MTIVVKAYANDDDVLIAWSPESWSNTWVGFMLERRDDTNGTVTPVANRIPPTADGPIVSAQGVSSAQSPIRRCVWNDYGLTITDNVSYRVTALVENGESYASDPAGVSDWTKAVAIQKDVGDGLEAYFNRGTLMSQVVSRFVVGDVTEASLKDFRSKLNTPGFPARRYLSGEARTQILQFLADADRRGSEFFAAIYEIGDRELVDAMKPFGARGHILIGNGDGTESWVAPELVAAGVDVRHRDLSRAGRSSPSVHNKFVVEVAGDRPTRVLTGSTNFTTTGLCTQLNNVLIVSRPTIAARFHDQWQKLVDAGDDMPDALKASNADPTSDTDVSVIFAATPDQQDFATARQLIKDAQQGALFLMFTPGNSPLLEDLLARAQENKIYVRGVVSRVQPARGNPEIVQVGGQVVKSGADPSEFHRDVLLPSGVTDRNKPSWAEAEFTAQEMLSQHMIAIVHSKTIVIDPFSDSCAVITGSHNLSLSASERNDENLVIIRGNKRLAQAYAIHINGVYDHYSWRNYVDAGGNPNQIYKPLDAWKPNGSRAQELSFWVD
ncbi:phospholipase D-like domain-containing protein [Paraburkholderia steynii]|uniref:phospholipase D-like domain-containing protein n=1 Tax=Paraburkholderia steynii TaxID=1245441 RepID=UPI001ABE10A2|nr:phospholipase D-like domain-containing protein [Paraburkholderia steynii]